MDAGLYKSVVWVHALLGVLSRQGIDSEQLFRDTPIVPGLLADGRARISLGDWRLLVKRTMALANDPGLGLTIGSTTPDNMVAQIAGASRSLREGLRMFDRYRPLMGNMNRFELVEEGERAYIAFSPLCPDPELGHFDAELGLSLVYRVSQRYAKHASDDADEIWFTHPAPAHVARYAQVFRCPVRFGCPRNAILFSRRYLDEVQIYANPVLLEALRESGDRLLTQQGTPSLTDRVRAVLRHESNLRGIDAERVAKVLKMNVRAFRRQLSDEDTPWSALLDEARCQIACDELRRGTAIIELTERLGFSEPSAFNRAFKRWTGTTPTKYSQGSVPAPALHISDGRRPRKHSDVRQVMASVSQRSPGR